MTNYIGQLVSSLLNKIFYLSQKISRVYISPSAYFSLIFKLQTLCRASPVYSLIRCQAESMDMLTMTLVQVTKTIKAKTGF